MRKKWRLSSSSGDFVFLHPESLFPKEIETCDPEKLAPTLEAWLKDKPSRQSLMEILSSLQSSQEKSFSSPSSPDEVKKGIIEALHGKQIVALRIPRSFLKQSNFEAPSAEDAPPPARPLTSNKIEKKTVWVEFRVVDDATGAPVSGVELQIFLPESQEVVQATDKGGQINLEDVAPGTCRVTSVLSGATLTRTLGFVQMGTKPSSSGANSSTTHAPLRMSGARIAEVSIHRVKTNDTLSALAKANKISEQDLEFFNFGTTDPDEINRYLRDRVGCTKKTRDGRNYLFDSTDKPGLIYLPKPWKKDGLATEQTHTIRVKRLAGFYVILENEYGLRIPEAKYEAKLADGGKREGKLGLGGVDLLENVPPGRVVVDFLDHEDIEAKSLAACARRAFDQRDTQEIYRVLNQPPERVKKVVAAYDQYFNDYTGEGLIEDIYQEFTDRRALIAIEGALAWAGLPTRNQVSFVKDES